MKRNRAISLILILSLLTALFAGCLTVSAAGTANTGTRHELCESLSSQAVSYYSGEYTWDLLSAKTGGNSSCLNSMNTPLFTALNKLMASTNTDSVSYTSLTSYWPTTDRSGGSSDAVLFYSDAVSSGYNREHVWPKSRGSFLKSYGGSDLHHLRPTNSNVNSTRGNHTMGNVRGVLSSYKTYEYGGKNVLYYDANYMGSGWKEAGIVEVNDNIKGDVARILLYVWCRWQEPNLFEDDPNPTLGPGDDANNGYRVIESLDTLLEWCENDPVDTWEMSRNDCCANIQGNRNVFIDYPEFAWLLFGQEVPDMDTPSGMAHEMQGGTTYTVTAVSSDETMGTVTGSGRAYTANPKEGYYVSGYTLEPNNAATVTQNGNSFTLSRPTEDCTLTVIFAPKTPVTLSFSCPAGVNCAALSGYAGEAIKLPTPTGTPSGEYEYKFKGWVAGTVDNSETKPAAIYTAGSDYIPTGTVTLYALYTYSVGGTGSSTTFTRLNDTEELIDGGQCVFTSTATGKAMSHEVGNNWVYPGGTYTGTTIESPAQSDIWTVSNGIINCSEGALDCGGAKSIDLSSEGSKWTITCSGGVWTLEANSCILCFNNTGWRPYSGTGYGDDKAFYIYQAGTGGTTYYTTVIGESCEHEYQASETVVATCTEGGYTVYTCTNCGDSYKAEEIAPLGHDYEAVVTAPTCVDKGFTTYTCTRCGDNYIAEETEAVGHDFVDGVCSRCGEAEPTEPTDPIETEPIETEPVVTEPIETEPTEPKDPCEGYIDIDRSAWYHEAADFVLARGIMGSTKTNEKTFEPTTSCTRAMIATMLYSLEGKPAVTFEAKFPDVKENQWFTDAVMWAYQNGVVSGYDNGSFGPNDKVTREQMAVILKAYAEQVKGLDTSEAADLSKFADAAKVTWSKPYITWAVAEGLISGKEQNGVKYLDPQGNATRAEVAAIMRSFIVNIIEAAK